MGTEAINTPIFVGNGEIGVTALYDSSAANRVADPLLFTLEIVNQQLQQESSNTSGSRPCQERILANEFPHIVRFLADPRSLTM